MGAVENGVQSTLSDKEGSLKKLVTRSRPLETNHEERAAIDPAT